MVDMPLHTGRCVNNMASTSSCRRQVALINLPTKGGVSACGAWSHISVLYRHSSHTASSLSKSIGNLVPSKIDTAMFYTAVFHGTSRCYTKSVTMEVTGGHATRADLYYTRSYLPC
jgi:hypothetical protein